MSILDFSYKSINIQGDYSFNKTSLLKYPYLYTISGNSVYKLNVITGISEVYANIDYSKLAKPYSSSLSDYLPQLFGSLKNINTDKFYFIIRVRDEQYDYSYYLCSFDLNTLQVNNHQKLSSLYVLYTNSTVYGMSSTIKQIDNDNLRIYHYWAYMQANAGSSGYRYSCYEVFNYNITTDVLARIISTNESTRQSTALPYQVNTMNPQIFNDSNEQFFYGQKYQNGSTNSSIGFSKVTPPSNGTTLNNSAYYYTGMFEYGDYYYIIGGSKGSSANTDLIKVNKNSMVSEKIGDISITSTPPSVSQYENIVVFINNSSRYLLIEFPLEDNKKLTLEELLSHTANAIRTKKGTTEKINAQDFASEIENLPSGAELNIHYGTTTPSDTTKLWVKRDITPSKVSMSSEVNGEGTEKIETLSTTLPSGLYAMGCAAVGTKIYLFGGYDSSGTSHDTIQMFDTTNNTLTTLSAKLPEAMAYLTCTAVGTKIYLFKSASIYIFNTLTNTISTSSKNLPISVSMPTSTAVGEKIYIFSGTTKIYIYDTIANSVSTSNLTFSVSMSYTSAVAVGEKIYLFGGQTTSGLNTIQVLDTTANTLTTSSATLLYAMRELKGAAVGTKIYLFGGYVSTYVNIIQVFDTETETLSKSNKTLPTTVSQVGCAAVGEKIYLFGGQTTGVKLDTINLFSIIKDLDLTSNNLLLHSKDIGTFKLLNSDTLDIEVKVGDCYYGNSNNKGEQVKIAVYKDSTWTELN